MPCAICTPKQWVDPRQLVLPVEPFQNDYRYSQGYDVGASWVRDYMPGGPHVYSGKNSLLKLESQTAHDSWMRGFEAGLLHRKQALENGV